MLRNLFHFLENTSLITSFVKLPNNGPLHIWWNDIPPRVAFTSINIGSPLSSIAKSHDINLEKSTSLLCSLSDKATNSVYLGM